MKIARNILFLVLAAAGVVVFGDIVSSLFGRVDSEYVFGAGLVVVVLLGRWLAWR